MDQEVLWAPALCGFLIGWLCPHSSILVFIKKKKTRLRKDKPKVFLKDIKSEDQFIGQRATSLI